MTDDRMPKDQGGHAGAKPWVKATALVTVSASGVVTGMSLAQAPAAALVSPAGVPATLPAGLQSALQAKLMADVKPDNTPQAGTTAAAVPGTSAPAASSSTAKPTAKPAASSSSSASKSSAKSSSTAPKMGSQQAFIALVAPGAIAAEAKYGVPASVTIAQAIDESDWGRSALAAKDNNLFGIKGTGTAGSVTYQTSEYEGGRWITIDAQFRAYKTVAQSIDDHAALLATSGYYTKAMADRSNSDAFANALTGVYATDPTYGSTLIALMRTYDLYKYDTPQAKPAAQPVPQSVPAASRAAAGTPAASAPTASAPSTPHQTSPQPTASIPGLVQPTTSAAAPGATAQHQTAGAATSPQGSQHAASVPGMASAPRGTSALWPTATAPAAGQQAATTAVAPQVTADVPGMMQPATSPAAAPKPTASPATAPQSKKVATSSQAKQGGTTATATLAAWYQPVIPAPVTAAYTQTAKPAIANLQPLYAEVAARLGISWKLLAACDWMQCQADPRRSPVYGEKLGAKNPDGSSYATKSQALAASAADLTDLAATVYGIDLTVQKPLSIRALAEVFAAYRWGGILSREGVSALEFPYAVAGLTAAHTSMRWPNVKGAPDRPGAKFREPFGAVPVVLRLGYPATV